MAWTELHATILAKAFAKVLGKAEPGAMAFARCLTRDIVERLARDAAFAPPQWQVWRVADADDETARTITADRAVEMREAKRDATLLLVDTAKAGAGMDGIYSAAREVDEATLFAESLRLARHEVTTRQSRQTREYAELAIKKARGHGRRYSVSLWTEFDFLVQSAAEEKHPAEYLHLLGLWPVQDPGESEAADGLDVSRLFVERLLGASVSGLTPTIRIEALKLLSPSEEQIAELERFLRSAAKKPFLHAMEDLADKKHLWVNALRMEGASQSIQSIDLSPWRTRTGGIAAWSGLAKQKDGDSDKPPELILKPDADRTGQYDKLEVRWKTRPEKLEKGAVVYRVAVVTDMDEELASREVSHSSKKEEKCRFSNDDFSLLSEDALIAAKVVVSVIGNDAVEPRESEEFVVRFGESSKTPGVGAGKKVRTFAEGLIELDDREKVSTIASSMGTLPTDSKGFVLLRTLQRGKSYRVFRPPLVREVEEQWATQSGAIGRWRIKVRASGVRAGVIEFVPLDAAGSVTEVVWDRAATASRRMAECFAAGGGGVAQVYDEKSKLFDNVVKVYLLAWAALLDEGSPSLALANTVEVQSLSGRTIGLIVLPSHPLRVAWHVAFDNLALYAAFEEKVLPKDVRQDLAILDGAMFPAFLPSLDGEGTFVFADTLGFHAVGMIPDRDKEPKAAVAILATALGESETAETAPTVGNQSAQVLGNEILRYLACHDKTSRLLHVHALRPGDGLTVARSLGRVHEQYHRPADEDDSDSDTMPAAPAFVLELYPSQEQLGMAGRFIAEAREKRRSGAGVLSAEDHWMLESLSLPGEVSLPRLRWARKEVQDPKSAAHLAVAFDTFESCVVPAGAARIAKARPFHAFGLISFLDREYVSIPTPSWSSKVPLSVDSEGEKHPSDRMHTERLLRLQHAVQRCVARSIGAEGDVPALRTDISPEKAQSLRELHRLCDWVITLDRNAGIEYFDSPRDNREIYDAYVIDCVPEREDLGCLQLITSTSNLEEVRNLLDGALDQMGLSRSRRNAEFLMEHLKALSGRLAIRLTGQKTPTSELIALAMCHANCCHASGGNDCWVPLEGGFIIPVDDVSDILPPLVVQEGSERQRDARPDLIHVSVVPRKGLLFRFIEVKYRKHLRGARSPDVVHGIREQVESLRSRWEDWYANEAVRVSSRALRRARLARMLRFYADKAHRHHLPKEQYEAMVDEIDRMIAKGGDYSFAQMPKCDRGWVFCPEYAGGAPLDISPPEWDTRVFLFGSGLMPDSKFRRDSIVHPPEGDSSGPRVLTPKRPDGDKPDGESDAPEPPSLAERDVTRGRDKFSMQDTGSTAELIPSVCFGSDLLTGEEVQWSLSVKGNPHLLMAGLPGMGKTTCLLNLCKQMLDAGIRPIVFSYHQDIDEKLERLVTSVRFIDFHGLGFNPLQVLDRHSRMAYLDVAGALRDIFIAIYPELGDIQGERIRKAIKHSFIEKGWDDPNATLSELQEPEFKRFVEILRDDPKPDKGLRTLLARLEELGDYGFFEVGDFCGSLWDSEEPIIIRIHTTQNDNLQKAFASLVFYGLYKDMFRRGIQDCITHAVVFDEAHRAAKLRLIPTMAKECRKYGISLVLASQEAKDFNISLFSAIANYLVLRLTEVDARALVRNVASSDQERALMDKIKQMERFKALYFCEGKKKPSLVALIG